MRAVILAAGRGSRMGELGDERPKCLVEFAKQPLIERQIAALRRGGAHAIGVVRGYRAHMIKLPDLTYFDNWRWSETNMATASPLFFNSSKLSKASFAEDVLSIL